MFNYSFYSSFCKKQWWIHLWIESPTYDNLAELLCCQSPAAVCLLLAVWGICTHSRWSLSRIVRDFLWLLTLKSYWRYELFDLTWLFTFWLMDVMSSEQLRFVRDFVSEPSLLSMSLRWNFGGTSPWAGIIPMSTSCNTFSCCLTSLKKKRDKYPTCKD